MTHSRKPNPIDLEALRADVESGMKKLEMKKKYHVGNLRLNALLAQLENGSEPGEPEDDSGPEEWWLRIDVPAERLDWVIGGLSHDDAIHALLSLPEQNKAECLQVILQRRVNEIIQSPEPADLESLGRRLSALAKPLTESSLNALTGKENLNV